MGYQPTSVAGVLHNYAATTNPAVTDDSGDGYSVGSLWLRIDTGQVWRLRDASVGAAKWLPFGTDDFVTYIVGNYYLPWGAGTPTTGATSQNNGNIKAFWGIIKQRVTISELGCNVATTNAGNCALAVYANKVGGFQPGLLIDNTGSITMAVAAGVFATIAANKTLEPGGYWWCSNSDNSAGIINCIQSGGFPAFFGSTNVERVVGSGTGIINGLSTAQAFASGWPADLSGTTFTESVTSGRTPAVVFKVASVP